MGAEVVTLVSESSTAPSESTPRVFSVLLELCVQLEDDFSEFALDTVKWSVATSLTAVATSEQNRVGPANDVGIVPLLTVPTGQEPVRWIILTGARSLAVEPVIKTEEILSASICNARRTASVSSSAVVTACL